MPELNNTILKNSANLKAYYRFESGALTTDSSGNGYALTNNNTVGEAAGKFGGAADFTNANTNKYFSIVSGPVTGTSARTIAGWCYQYQIDGNNQGFFGIGSASATRAAFNFYTAATSGEMLIICYGDNLNSGVNVTAGTWFHAAITYDSATFVIRLYINGKHIASKTLSGGLNTDAVFNIGKSSYEATYADAIVDDMGVFDIALSADQIKELYEGRYLGEGWPQTGLVALYHLSSETDFSGNNYHLTNNGTVTFPQGRFNKAADLGASNTTKWLYVLNNLGITGNSCTMAGWFKLNTEIGSSIYTFLRQGDSGVNVNNNILYDYNSGARRLWFIRSKNGIGDEIAYYTITLGTTNWYYLVYTYDTTTIKGYVNGNLVTSQTASGSGNAGLTSNFVIGNINSTAVANLPASMIVDEVQIYNVAKSADWVRKQYAWAKGMFL